MTKVEKLPSEYDQGWELCKSGVDYNQLTSDKKAIYDLAAKDYFNEKIKVKFSRHDGQAPNYLSSKYKDKWLDWKGKLISGGIYELPRGVVKFLRSLNVPRYKEVEFINEVGRKEFQLEIIGSEDRFSLQEVA